MREVYSHPIRCSRSVSCSCPTLTALTGGCLRQGWVSFVVPRPILFPHGTRRLTHLAGRSPAVTFTETPPRWYSCFNGTARLWRAVGRRSAPIGVFRCAPAQPTAGQSRAYGTWAMPKFGLPTADLLCPAVGWVRCFAVLPCRSGALRLSLCPARRGGSAVVFSFVPFSFLFSFNGLLFEKPDRINPRRPYGSSPRWRCGVKQNTRKPSV